jgi:quercetin dioxygenase-like cupin family protein
VRGEIYLVTETDEVLMQPGDTVIIRGVNHAWSNRSSAPCLLVGTNTDATPLDQH